jgi:hypothetical protein
MLRFFSPGQRVCFCSFLISAQIFRFGLAWNRQKQIHSKIARLSQMLMNAGLNRAKNARFAPFFGLIDKMEKLRTGIVV